MYKISESMYWLANRPVNFKSNCQRFSLMMYTCSIFFPLTQNNSGGGVRTLRQHLIENVSYFQPPRRVQLQNTYFIATRFTMQDIYRFVVTFQTSLPPSVGIRPKVTRGLLNSSTISKSPTLGEWNPPAVICGLLNSLIISKSLCAP